MGDTQIMELADGRELAWLEMGDHTGKAIFGFHGTPGSRFQVVIDEESLRRAGVRLICVDRPGYGHSSFHPGRTIAGWPADVHQLAEHLGLDTFGVVGISGGGPHALACAALMPGRVAVAGVLSGVGPLSAPGAEDAMMPINVLITRMSRRSSKMLELLFVGLTAAHRRWPQRMLRAMVRQLPPADAEILNRPEVRHVFLREASRASATSGKAAAQDFQLFVRDWGFRIEDIEVPVHLWHGDADRNVPVAHARQMAAAIPGAALHEIAGGGHFVTLDHAAEIFTTLAGYL